MDGDTAVLEPETSLEEVETLDTTTDGEETTGSEPAETIARADHEAAIEQARAEATKEVQDRLATENRLQSVEQSRGEALRISRTGTITELQNAIEWARRQGEEGKPAAANMGVLDAIWAKVAGPIATAESDAFDAYIEAEFKDFSAPKELITQLATAKAEWLTATTPAASSKAAAGYQQARMSYVKAATRAELEPIIRKELSTTADAAKKTADLKDQTATARNSPRATDVGGGGARGTLNHAQLDAAYSASEWAKMPAEKRQKLLDAADDLVRRGK